MQAAVDIREFLHLSETLPVIDVRSPGEFEKGHIPGAHNIPLFDNQERASVGTCYKQRGRDEAVLLGLELVGPKMAGMVKAVANLAPSKKVLVHCWRGGMRSGSFAWLLNTAGFQATCLKRGYKAYRHHLHRAFEKPYRLIILGGETGSGKTDILKEIQKSGQQVIDLEGLAHHKGSSFGALGQEAQPPVETFENSLGHQLLHMDPLKPVWLEDESKSIGRVFIPEAFWKSMKAAPLVRVEVPQPERVKRLVKEYGQFPVAELEAAVLRIQKRIGGLALKQCLEALKEGKLDLVAELTLTYYDKAYNFNKEKNIREVISVSTDNPAATAREAIDYVNKQGASLWENNQS